MINLRQISKDLSSQFRLNYHYQNMILWRERNIKQDQFIIILSLFVGIFTAIAAIILKNTIHIDISAILLRRRFIVDRQIRFFDSCSHGYSEEFVFRCLLEADVIAQSPTIMKRDHIYELKRGKQKPVGKNIFQHTDAMLRIADIIRTSHQGDTELVQLFEHEKLPLTVMNGVDIMLKEGMGYNSIRGYLRVSGYGKFLVTGKQTDKALKRRIAVWNAIPWMYKAK